VRSGVGLTAKVFAATALVVVAALALALVLTELVVRPTVRRALDERLAGSSDVVRLLIEAEHARLASGAAACARTQAVSMAVVAGDSGTVRDQAELCRAILGADFTLISDRQGVLVARSDQDGAAGDSLGGPLLGGALEGGQTAGYVVERDRDLFLAVGTPLRDAVTDSVLAVLLAAARVTDSLATRLQDATGSALAFYVLDADHRPVVVAASAPRSAALDHAVRTLAGAAASPVGDHPAELEMGADRFVGITRSFANPGAGPLGGVLLWRSLDEELVVVTRLRMALGGAGAVGLLLACAAAFAVARRIARPIRGLTAAARHAAEGDYTEEVPTATSDDVGQLAGAFRHLLDELQAREQLLGFLGAAVPGAAASNPAGGSVAMPTMVRAAASNTGMLAVGQRFAGRYEIKSVLGTGAMGAVYRAWDAELGAQVALRTLAADVASADTGRRQRFLDELHLVQRIAHRNVARTHDVGEVEGLLYVSMEVVEGPSLQRLLQDRGRLPASVVVTLGKQLCRGLEAAHALGVIHRDLRPQRIIVGSAGTLKLLGFGLARLASGTDGATYEGMAAETPEYLAPEQLLGAEVDVRADVYAAGGVLFECLTGRPPFVADSPILLVSRKLEEVPPALRSLNTEVPEALEQVVLAALDKDRDRRPAGAAALHDLLDGTVV
jgi:serine/threonine-protein kinase